MSFKVHDLKMEASTLVRCLVTDHYSKDTVSLNNFNDENINFFYKTALESKIGPSLKSRIDMDSIKIVAEGCSKDVFSAFDSGLNRRIALCFPKYQCQKELDIYSQIDHPSVIELLDFQGKEETGFDIMSMELLAGSLKDLEPR